MLWELFTAVGLVLAGHATIRQQVLGDDYKRRSRAAENARLRTLVDQAMAGEASAHHDGVRSFRLTRLGVGQIDPAVLGEARVRVAPPPSTSDWRSWAKHWCWSR